MLWIIGSIVMIFLGTVLMCALIAGGRADDRKESMWQSEPANPLLFSDEEKSRVFRECISPALYDSSAADFIAAEKGRLRGDRSRNPELNPT